MEENAELRANTTMASESANTEPEPAAPNAELQTVHSNKSREEGELSSSDCGDANPDISAVQSTPVAESNAVPLVQKSTQSVQGGSNNEQLQTTKQSTSQKSFIKNQLPPKSSPWTGHVGTDKNLVISFSDDDSGSDFETKGNGSSRLESKVKRTSSALVKSNKLQLQQNGRGVNKAMPNRLSSNHIFISPVAKNFVSNSKGAGSVSLGQGSRARYFNPMNKKLAIRERGLDQGVVSNDSKLQDLRHQIALRENELKLKAAQQNKESASVLARDHNALNLKNVTVRKYVSSEAPQLEPKEPDRKRMKLATSYGTPQAVSSQQEIPASKSILPLVDSAVGNYYPLERNNVDHCQKEIPLCREEPTIIRSQRQPEKHPDNSLQNMPCRSKDGDVNYGSNKTDMGSRLVDPCVAFNQSAVPPNMTSISIPKNLEALNNAVLPNHNGNTKELTDLESFFGMEELIDKELEEAQEHRHKCEIEERNALRIYLKAQRSLLEANARCTNLYRRREMYSAKLRSLILNNSSFSWSSGQNQNLDIGLDFLPRHGYEIPTSSCQRLAEYNDINNPSFDSNNQGINNGRSNTSYHRVTGENLGSEPCGEPDASTSEPLPQMGNNAVNGVSSPSDELDTSANENEENSPAGVVSNNLDAEYHRNQDSNTRYMDIDTASNAKFSADRAQDSFLLEATLRSELVARLGARAIKTHIPSNNIEPSAERGAENEVRSEKNLEHHGAVPPSRMDDQDIERHGGSIHLDSNEIQSQQNISRNSLDSNCSAGSGDQGHMPCRGHHSTNTMNIPPLIFRSAFSELREMSSCYSNQYQNKNKSIHTNNSKHEGGTCLSSDKTKSSDVLAIPMPVTVGNLLSEESSYSCSPVVDPFWPLCMYELRGKCNNDECPWQHVKDYSDGNIYQHPDSNDADCQGRLSLHQQNYNGDKKVPKCHKAPIPPTYLVGLHVLKADQFAYKPVVAHRNTHCWQKYFSITFATSNLLRSGLPADAPLLHDGDERIEVHGLWNKQLSSFQWRSGAGNQIKQAMADSEQAVEMALLVLNQEINKLQGARKALSILSKALETDPTSMVLWIVYLLIYYGNFKPNEKNDMFFCAVKHCEQSYILWLMYINSQRKLDDRLAAYDTALSALCCHASSVLKDRMHESACILDLFLQMLDCLCMSGNVEKAINRSYGILPATTKSDEPLHLLSLSDILNCLTISDKCVFWVCCVYLVIYRKLPDAVVQKFECEKELLDIEWPFIRLPEDDMEMAVKVVETAVESVDLCLFSESVKSDVNLRSAQLFALNHIRCMVALDRLECSRNLLDKYMKLYPSCIELTLVSARIEKQESSVDHFMGFEEAISRWPNEFPGIHCIWNQFIENAIQNQRIDFAKEITARWFHSVCEPQDLRNGGGMDAIGGGNSCGSSGLNSKTALDKLSSDHTQMDMMFGFINLSLYNIFQNDVTEASIAVDKARSIAGFGGLEPCIRKHAMFLLCDALSLKEDGPYGAMKKILDIYMDNSSQTFLVPKVLTRKFVDNIKKPRVQHLISKILTPVSFDCSLLNLILQSWFGSSLISQMAGEPKHLVDFVEAIMEVVPYNYQLAITVCKQLSKSYNSSDLNSVSLWFWACSNLVNAIFDSIPIPPEYVWVEAGEILHNAVGIEAISERFYRRALSVYPFSKTLWKCFYRLRKTGGEANDVVEAAKERGIELD